MLAILVDLVVFLAGAVGLGAAVRAWRTGPDGEPVPNRWAIGIYILLVLLFFSPALLTPGHQLATDIPYRLRPWNEMLPEEIQPRNPLLADLPFLMTPFRDLVRQRFLAGELPLWANELGTGQPLLANGQSAPFAPLHLPLLPLPTLRALTIAAAWQTVLGLLLMHALLRRLRAPPMGAALAAVAFGFSTFAVAWCYYPMGMSAMWVPGVLLGVLLLADRAPRGATGLVVCGLGLALSGHPETLAHVALVAAVVVGWLLVVRPWQGLADRGRFLLELAGAAALTFALAAPFLLPILEALPASERAESLALAPHSVRPSNFKPWHLAWLVDPAVGGSPREGGWAGPSNFNEHATLYGGLIPLVLALAGALVLRGRVLAIVLGGVVALLGAFRLDPVHALLVGMPVIGDGAHGRLRLMWIPAVAVAAGLSLEAVTRSRGGRAVFVALLVVALGLLIGLGTPPPFWLRAWWLTALVGGLALLAVPWLVQPRVSGDGMRKVFAVTALVVLIADLGVLGIRFNPVVPPELDLTAPPVLAWIVERHREEMTGDPEDRDEAGLRPFRVLGDEWALFANVPALYGLWNLRGHDPMRLAASARFVDRATLGRYAPGAMQQNQKVNRGNVAAHSYLGVRYLLTRHRRKPPAPAWQRVYRHQGGRVWENSKVLPLFFLPAAVETVEPAPRGEAGNKTENEVLDRALAIAHEPEGYAGRAVIEGIGAGGAQQGTVRLTAVGANRFAMEVTSPTGGVVVSSVGHDPGWRVRVGGAAAPLLRANSAFLAFAVPPGEHAVELVYSPSGWRWGLGLFAAGLAALAVLAGLAARRRRAAASVSRADVTPSATPPPVGSTPPVGPATDLPAA